MDVTEAEVCERPGTPLFHRLTLIIVAIIAIFLLVNCSWNLFLLNKVSGNNCNLSRTEINNARIINILGIILGIGALLWVAYGILAPLGTWNEYIRPFFQRKVVAVETEKPRPTGIRYTGAKKTVRETTVSETQSMVDNGNGAYSEVEM